MKQQNLTILSIERNSMKQILFLLAVTSLLLIGCSPTAGEEGIEVQDVWGPSSPSAAPNGAIYMVITNNSGQDDQLLGIITNACAAVELHEMQMAENDVMVMRQVPGGTIDLPAGESVELKVGGLHVMCIDKQLDFIDGERFPITLDFATAEDQQVVVEIRSGLPE